jgi:hypothetical protein
MELQGCKTELHAYGVRSRLGTQRNGSNAVPMVINPLHLAASHRCPESLRLYFHRRCVWRSDRSAIEGTVTQTELTTSRQVVRQAPPEQSKGKYINRLPGQNRDINAISRLQRTDK